MTHPRNLSTNFPDRDALVQGAIRAARAAAQTSGAQIREIEELDELQRVSRLLSIVWNRAATSPQMTADLLRALSKTGNYVSGAFLDGQLIGAAVAFFSASSPVTGLHSHIAGVTDGNQARNVGYALKLHQRAWALHRRVSTITWTFDPLVRRNAHFNISKLGARIAEYLPNFYGEMLDRINGGDQTDRLLVEWQLLAPNVVSICDDGDAAPTWEDDPTVGTALHIAADGTPLRSGWAGRRSVLMVPPDVERMRHEAPALAREWRLALRDVLGDAMANGASVVGFRQTEGYVVDAAVEPS